MAENPPRAKFTRRPAAVVASLWANAILGIPLGMMASLVFFGEGLAILFVPPAIGILLAFILLWRDTRVGLYLSVAAHLALALTTGIPFLTIVFEWFDGLLPDIVDLAVVAAILAFTLLQGWIAFGLCRPRARAWFGLPPLRRGR